jgi:hypothetical protein
LFTHLAPSRDAKKKERKIGQLVAEAKTARKELALEIKAHAEKSTLYIFGV